MRYEDDHETDVLTIVLREMELDHGEQTGNVILHYGTEGKPVEIEGAAREAPRADERELVQIEILDASQEVLKLLGPMLARRPDAAEA